MCWLQATIMLDPFLFPNNSPPLDHYLPSPCAVIFLVYLRHPPLNPTLPSQPLSSIISPVDQNRIPSQALPNPVCLPGQRETVLSLSSCSRGSPAFINHFDSATVNFVPSSFPPLPRPAGKPNHCVMRLKKQNPKGEKCGRDVRNKGM